MVEYLNNHMETVWVYIASKQVSLEVGTWNDGSISRGNCVVIPNSRHLGSLTLDFLIVQKCQKTTKNYLTQIKTKETILKSPKNVKKNNYMTVFLI